MLRKLIFFFLSLFVSYLLDLIPEASAEKHKLAHLLGSTWLCPPVQTLQASQARVCFLEGLTSGKLRGRKTRTTRLFNRPSINCPTLENIPAELGGFVFRGYWEYLFVDGKKTQTVLCTFRTHQCDASRHWGDSLPYEKKNALGCKRRKNSFMYLNLRQA